MVSEKDFDKFFRQYYPVLCAYARRYVREQFAEEIAQEVMIWIWENRRTLVFTSSMDSYLFRMIHNKALNLIARKKTAAKAETAYFTRHQHITESMDLHKWQVNELTTHLLKALTDLPDPYREAFVLHRWDGKSYKKIAEMLNVSPKTVDYRIQQALKILRVELKDYLPFIPPLIVMNLFSSL